MSATAFSGPIVVFGQSALGSEYNPEIGPSALYQGSGLLDPRTPFTYIPGQRASQPNYVFLGQPALLVDQAPSAIAAANIAASQAPSAGTALTLVSSSGSGITIATSITRSDTGATVTGLLAIDTAMSPVQFGPGGSGTGGAMSVWDPTKAIARNVRITTNADDTGGSYTVKGFDIYNYPVVETITGVNNGVASGKKAFKYILSVTPNATINSTLVSVGTGDVYGLGLAATSQAYVDGYWNNASLNTGSGTAAQQTVTLTMPSMALVVNNQLYEAKMPFDGHIVSALWRDTIAVTTGAKAVTLTAQAAGSNVTGGVIAVSGAYATGATQAGSAVTGGNTFTAGQTVGVIATSVTTFIEGAGQVELTVQNDDLAGGTFTAPDTNTATATTGDVRGTIAVPSASDGTKKLQIWVTPSIARLKLYGATGGIFGVTQFTNF